MARHRREPQFPTRSEAGASASHISVSIASNWQKKKRRFESRCSGSRQCCNRRLRDAGRAGIVRVAPSLHARPDLIHEWQFHENAGIIECAGLLRSADISGFPSLRLARK